MKKNFLNNKLDTSFLKDVSNKETKNTKLNSLLMDDLNEIENKLNEIRNISLQDDKLNDNDMVLSFNDSMMVDSNDESKKEKVIETTFEKSERKLFEPPNSKTIDLLRKEQDRSIYDDIKELEILYSEFKKK